MLRRGLPLESALDAAARDLERADDRAFAHAIAAEALRRLTDLDALIDSATKKNLPDDAKARFALRIALVQALAMETPPHAAIATVLPLVDGGPRRLVHGVFGALMRGKATLPEPPTLPPAVAARWEKNWGADVVEAAARLAAIPPPLDLCFPPDAAPDMEGVSLMPGHLRLPSRTAVAGLTGYGEGSTGGPRPARSFGPGRWWVQDVAASIPARLLGRGEGRSALDLCAAPGGKTMQLAGAGFDVTAVDASESSARIVAADMLKWAPDAPVDAVLLDAPCSATGIYRRHPEVLHRVRPRAVRDLADAQRIMLARAADWVRPGGTLVYSVCSLEPEEGEAVADIFLTGRADFRLDPVEPGALAPEIPLREGRVRVLPGTFEAEGGADGFFVARFRRIDGDK